MRANNRSNSAHFYLMLAMAVCILFPFRSADAREAIENYAVFAVEDMTDKSKGISYFFDGFTEHFLETGSAVRGCKKYATDILVTAPLEYLNPKNQKFGEDLNTIAKKLDELCPGLNGLRIRTTTYENPHNFVADRDGRVNLYTGQLNRLPNGTWKKTIEVTNTENFLEKWKVDSKDQLYNACVHNFSKNREHDPRGLLKRCEQAFSANSENESLKIAIGVLKYDLEDYTASFSILSSIKGSTVITDSYIGLMYANGYGTEQDIDLAIAHYKRAVDGGSGWAARAIGNMYYNGTGVSHDYEKAKEWYQRAVDLGDEQAKILLGLGKPATNDTSVQKWECQCNYLDGCSGNPNTYIVDHPNDLSPLIRSNYTCFPQ